jgi:hypothetical protein
MEKINSENDLQDAILQLESKWAEEGNMVKEQFHVAIESIKPINLIKNTFREAVTSRDLKSDIINTSVGLTAGYLSKIVFASVMKTPMTKLFGNAVMLGVTKVVARNPETVKSLGKGFLKMIRGKPKSHTHEIPAGDTML